MKTTFGLNFYFNQAFKTALKQINMETKRSCKDSYFTCKACRRLKKNIRLHCIDINTHIFTLFKI